MVAKGDTRRALMHRFPCVLFFRIACSDTVRITVVKHERRHPAFGMDRH